jgi:putative ABC transport system permease protein
VSDDTRGSFPASGVIATPGYFEALGIACQKGRTFSDRDGLSGTPAVVIVNRRFATTHWPEGDPIGRRVKMSMGRGTQPEWRTVVGVVDDVLGAPRDAALQVYVPFEQSGYRDMTIAVKASSDPLAMVAPVRQRLARLDRNLPLSTIATMEAVVDDARWMPRTLMRMFLVFGVLALALASAGIYGVLAYSVSRRTREMGIRSALGASSGQIGRIVLREGLGPAAVGIVIGLVASVGVTRLLRALLSGVSPTDPLSYAVTAVVLLASALVACSIPARRATRVDPMVALRHE